MEKKQSMPRRRKAGVFEEEHTSVEQIPEAEEINEHTSVEPVEVSTGRRRRSGVFEDEFSMESDFSDKSVSDKSVRTPGISFLDQTLMNWSDDIKLYGGTFAASFNRLGSEVMEEEVGESQEQEEWIESSLKPIREDYLAHEAARNLTYENGVFWDKAKTLAADLVRPTMVAEALAAGGISSGIRSIPVIEKLGAAVAEWGQASLGTATKYIGSAARGASEVALFEGLDIAGKEVVDIPVEHIGEHILGGALLGGVMGVGGALIGETFGKAISAAKLRKDYLNELNRQLCYPEETFSSKIRTSPIAVKNGEPVLETRALDGLSPSVGAAAAAEFRPLPKAFTWGPLAQSWNSKSQVVREMSETYFGNMYERTETGGMASITDMMQSDRGILAEFTIEYNNHLKRFAAGLPGTGKKITKAIRNDFNQEWLNGAIEGGKTSNAVINGFVSRARDIFHKMGKESVELGLLPETVLEKEYFPQYYDKSKISADRNGWINALENGLRDANPRKDFTSPAGLEELTSIVNDIDETVYWVRRNGGYAKDGSPIAASLKERDVHINQKFLRDYLISDPLALMDSYVTSMGFNIAEAKALKRLGYNNFKEVEEKFLREQGGYVTDSEAAEGYKLLLEMPRIVSGQFDAARRKELDLAMGGSWARQAIGMFQDLNVARFLGGVGIAGAVDIAANAAKGTTCRHICGLIKHCFGGALGGLTKEEAMAAGFAIDDLLAETRHVSSVSTLEDIPSKIGDMIAKSREKVTRPLAEFAINLSKIRILDGARERVASSLNCLDVGSKILAGERKVGKLEGEVLERIKAQLEKYKTTDPDGISFYNLSSWDDALARADFEAEIRRGVRGEVFRPNIGDIPNAMRTPHAKIFGMFYSFSCGMVNSIILPMAQAGRYGQLATLVAASSGYEILGEFIRSHIRGNPYDLNSAEDIEKLAYRGLAKAPVISQLMSGVNIVTFGQFGESIMKSGYDLSSTILRGGNLSFAFDAFDAARSLGQIAAGKRVLTQKEARKMIKIIPFQNNYFVRPLFNIMISNLPEHTSVKQSRLEQSRLKKESIKSGASRSKK
jgi:hypothetical protein